MRKTLIVLLAPILLLPVGCQKSKDSLNSTEPIKKQTIVKYKQLLTVTWTC